MTACELSEETAAGRRMDLRRRPGVAENLKLAQAVGHSDRFRAERPDALQPGTFTAIDYVVVPSESARQHYWETLGLACQVLPPVVGPLNDERPPPDHLRRDLWRVLQPRFTHQPGPPLVPREAGVGL